ncbi:hypothetical protein [Nitratidesulfovibrio sp. SRB-5]|uniref:hypothetical protein n=1 Tax=Nitratidesulfovibrio sp. SRB-5 TaxID=2872636 RepID=UPI0010260790|nr:hypothetical protein [Nitratidesulfovibrio sp. SRB-5]MBZ2173426.1 hypothetical protein [Nitratidesulfovibrio sp. SRB-5]RXF77187.1 hypothetical protein EKK70_08065 [Desulfovibrio sp. DS-1]
MHAQKILNNLAKSLPDIFARTEVGKLTGGLIAPRTLANLDCLGKGPNGKVKFMRKVGYEKTAFLDWFAEYLKETDNA